jgi:NADPH-dependent glutamate synthase beta subunit-like oxidoreductase
MRTSSSHEEGVERDFAVLTKRAVGKNGKIEALECARIDWAKGADGRMAMVEVEGSRFELKADLCCSQWASGDRASPVWSSRRAWRSMSAVTSRPT